MRTYKQYVKNPTHPEGCIAERYIMEESMAYCMEYMPNGRMGSHKRGRGTFMDDDAECAGEYPIDKRGKVITLGGMEYQQVRRWVLQCSDAAIEWNE